MSPQSEVLCAGIIVADHVCTPVAGGDAAYLARMLRVLAVDGYLELFSTSTRERAVDFRNWDLFGDIPIPHVNSGEQRRVGAILRALRPLSAAADRSVALLRERRHAVLSAAINEKTPLVGVVG